MQLENQVVDQFIDQLQVTSHSVVNSRSNDENGCASDGGGGGGGDSGSGGNL